MRYLILGLAVLTSACGSRLLHEASPTAGGAERGEMAASTTPVCTSETLSCFTATIELSREVGPSLRLEGLSQDLPTPGFANRWRYLLASEAGGQLEGMMGGWHRAEVCGGTALYSGRGGMFQVAGGYWRLDMEPTDNGVADQFAALPGAYECREQSFRVSYAAAGEVEILIEELL